MAVLIALLVQVRASPHLDREPTIIDNVQHGHVATLEQEVGKRACAVVCRRAGLATRVASDEVTSTRVATRVPG
ncbi:MAG TPA: hypothetical protein VF469_24975 [Kofleriaceae bacterium]